MASAVTAEMRAPILARMSQPKIVKLSAPPGFPKVSAKVIIVYGGGTLGTEVSAKKYAMRTIKYPRVGGILARAERSVRKRLSRKSKLVVAD